MTDTKELIKPGDIIWASWGYNMTINDYAKVLENTGKTLKCVMISTKVFDDNGMGGGRSVPAPEKVTSAPFRLRIRPSGHIVGSYPFVANDKSKRFGYFSKWEGNPNYYNTWD